MTDENYTRIVKAFAPIAATFERVAQHYLDTFYLAYLQNGAIYGESQADMLRWLDELNTIAALEYEAQYLRDRQQAIADFRQMIRS